MINIDNASFVYNDNSFENISMDNSLITQNERFDYIMDLENNIADIKMGEIGVPVYYHLELGINVGDTISIQSNQFSKDFVVTEIIRDAQMNAALTSSKRFLISETDFKEIQGQYGSMEYSFQFLLEEGISTSELETDYKNAALPSNGVGISKSILNMMNSISYGLNGYIIILTSIILIVIGLLCLNYIIKTTLFDEQATLGELKAIGLPDKQIVKLYVAKYVSIALLMAILGYILSFPLVQNLSSSVILYCGKGRTTVMTWITPLIGISFLLLLVFLRSKRNTKQMLKHNVLSLKRKTATKHKEGKYKLQSIQRWKNINILMILGEIKCKWKQFILISFVFILSSFLIVIPSSLLETINNPSFIKYMGVGESDIRVDLPYNDDLQTQVTNLDDYLSSNPEIQNYEIYQVGSVQLETENDQINVRVTNGDFDAFPIEFLEGTSPKKTNDIGFSILYKDEFGFQLNDTVTIQVGDQTKEFTVVGFYQDITYGGKTAKAFIEFDDSDTEVYIAYINVKNNDDITDIVSDIKSNVTGSKVTPVSEFVEQTMGGISESLALVRLFTTIIALILIATITALVMQLMISKEHSEIAIKKSLGFTDRVIQVHYSLRILIILVFTILFATLISGFFGELLLSMLMSSMGASKITLLSNRLTVYLFNPMFQIIVVLITVILSTRTIQKYHIKDQIME